MSKDALSRLQDELRILKQKLEVAREALSYYANRMDSGATAREALAKLGEKT